MKPHYILDILNRGYDVLYCDMDVVWFERPYQYLKQKSDVYIVQNQGPPDPTILYTGFAMYRQNKSHQTIC